MERDDHFPQFSQKQVSEATAADPRTVENYVQYGYVKPALIDGRRRFTIRQLLKVEFIYRLNTVMKIPPKAGAAMAERILMQDGFGLRDDLEAIDPSNAWPYRRPGRLEFVFDPNAPDDAAIAPASAKRPDSIHMVFPARLFSRLVLQRAAELMPAEHRD